MSYKNSSPYLDIAKELLTNRYILNTILINQLTILDYLNDLGRTFSSNKETKEKAISNIKKKTRNNEHNYIKFEHFTIGKRAYKGLIKQFGIEVTQESIILLDSHIKHSHKRYKKPIVKLREFCKWLKIQQRVSDEVDRVIQESRDSDYTLIEDRDLAFKYCIHIPEWQRGYHKGYKYLVDKFKLMIGEDDD